MGLAMSCPSFYSGFQLAASELNYVDNCKMLFSAITRHVLLPPCRGILDPESPGEGRAMGGMSRHAPRRLVADINSADLPVGPLPSVGISESPGMFPVTPEAFTGFT